MKSRILLLLVFLLGATMFHPTVAKADLLGDLLGGLFGNNNNTQGTNLPINGDAIYLMIAGLAIGIVAVKKVKKAEATIKA
jgi:hypothetical protein